MKKRSVPLESDEEKVSHDLRLGGATAGQLGKNTVNGCEGSPVMPLGAASLLWKRAEPSLWVYYPLGYLFQEGSSWL